MKEQVQNPLFWDKPSLWLSRSVGKLLPSQLATSFMRSSGLHLKTHTWTIWIACHLFTSCSVQTARSKQIQSCVFPTSATPHIGWHAGAAFRGTLTGHVPLTKPTKYRKIYRSSPHRQNKHLKNKGWFHFYMTPLLQGCPIRKYIYVFVAAWAQPAFRSGSETVQLGGEQ